MSGDDLFFVDAGNSTRVEHRIDQWIRIVVGLSQRLANGAPPELARLDSIQIDGRPDALTKNSEQPRIARVRREVLIDTLRREEVIDVAVDAINA